MRQAAKKWAGGLIKWGAIAVEKQSKELCRKETDGVVFLFLQETNVGETAQRTAEIITINRYVAIKAAADMMHDKGIGCLVVTDDRGTCVGLITERDIVGRVVGACLDPEKTCVEQVMTKEVVAVLPGTPIETVRHLMAENQIRHLPVIENNVVVGMHSIRDVVAQQLVRDRAAAEEIARLSTCLRSIDINEVTEVIVTEVPKLFEAQRCVLYLRNDGSAGTPAIYKHKNCLCPPHGLVDPAVTWQCSEGVGFCRQTTPTACVKKGVSSDCLAIRLDIGQGAGGPGTGKLGLRGALCMCGLDPALVANQIAYKSRLCRDVLTSHLTNAQLYQQARLTSLTDTLTGVGSRRFLEDSLQIESDRAKRYDRPLSVAIMDIDNFKSINDTLGHSTGDEALRKLAECIEREKRSTDILARYGGDEFVLLMPETAASEALNLIERLRQKVRQIELADGASITVSCGIAESSADVDSSSGEVIRRADRALYDAKSAGRNCARIWEDTSANAPDENEVQLEKVKRLQRRIAGLSEKSEKMFIQSIWGLVQALEAKDAYTRRHSENVMRYCAAIAETMQIGPKQIEMLRHAAMIHDIGKIGIPDAILAKRGKLTDEERLIIEQHPVIAVQILEKMNFLDQEIAIIRHHHEKWSGNGYPDGLAGEQIPMGARIIGVADTFDAITSTRAYHESRSVKEAVDIMTKLSGKDFDPDIVDAMVSWVRTIAGKAGSIDQVGPEHLLQSSDCDGTIQALVNAGAHL